MDVVTPSKILALRRLRKNVSECEAQLSHTGRPCIQWRGGRTKTQVINRDAKYNSFHMTLDWGGCCAEWGREQ